MKSERRQFLLKSAAALGFGLLMLDTFGVGPAIERWREQTLRITALRLKVDRGRQVAERAAAVRARWAAMLRANLPADLSEAENIAFKAVGRWVRESQISLTSLTSQSQWQTHDEGYETLECRVSATGSQAALGRFLHEMEADASIPVNLEECELASRDARGSELTLTARLTFLRLSPKTPIAKTP